MKKLIPDLCSSIRQLTRLSRSVLICFGCSSIDISAYGGHVVIHDIPGHGCLSGFCESGSNEECFGLS